ncbi:uncharacterized protein LOC100374455 [Saccoglossus kowalevskii]|uniref:Protein PRY2-like n=1 Tax=Saccoglossus kowalevskii TaxID=10224 RepID=A0ABM0LX25_SACKO|nr:PREDICTED: protein PRY2-like [Saccoglossus kowalevskii]
MKWKRPVNIVLYAVVFLVVEAAVPAVRPERDTLAGGRVARLEVNTDLCMVKGYPYICADQKSCVKENQICDGKKNCMDDSDEADCPESGGRKGGDGDGGDTGGDCSGNAKTTQTTGPCSNPTAKVECNSGLGDLRQQMLNAHNYYRCLHGITKPLVLADDLNNYAQAWAEEVAAMPVEPKGHEVHSTNRGENPPDRGENYFSFANGYTHPTEDKLTGEYPVSMWYSEEVKWDYSTNSAKPPATGNDVGHFTAIVWKSTYELGCGVATKQLSYGPKFFIVCQYRKPANIGDPAKNVPKKLY